MTNNKHVKRIHGMMMIYPPDRLEEMNALENARKQGEVSFYTKEVGPYEEVTYFLLTGDGHDYSLL